MTATRRITVDMTPLGPGGQNGGAGLVATSLVRHLSSLRSDWDFVLLTSAESHAELAGLEAPNVRRVCVRSGNIEPAEHAGSTRTRPVVTTLARRGLLLAPPRLRVTARAAVWRMRHGNRNAQLIRELQPDLLFCPFTVPYYWIPNVRTVTILHDLQHVAYPEFFSAEQRLNREQHVRDAVRRSDCIVCVSEHVRETLVQYIPSAIHNARTIPHGILQEFEDQLESRGRHGMLQEFDDQSESRRRRGMLEEFEDQLESCDRRGMLEEFEDQSESRGRHSMLQEFADQSESPRILEQHGLQQGSYLLYPANFWPHKNHLRLFEALQRVLDSSLKLVCTGAPNEMMRSLQNQARAILGNDRVVFAGYLPPHEFQVLLDGCKALVYPSLYEGFGMPVLEAMARGKPVLCSNVTSLPEVAGDAAFYFDPMDANAIAEAISTFDRDSVELDRRVALGYERARHFGSADAMARRYAALFDQILDQR